MIVVFSPHCDDAIFSLGAHLSNAADDVLIAAPMAGIPEDAVGRAKYRQIHAEHDDACKLIGATYRNGPFLDDVYPKPNLVDLQVWLRDFLAIADTAYIPVGIHHPDHLRVSNLLLITLQELTDQHRPYRGKLMFYDELPYRIEYPIEADARRRLAISELGGNWACIHSTTPNDLKRSACLAYRSQTNHYGTDRLDEDLMVKLMVPETVWEWTR